MSVHVRDLSIRSKLVLALASLVLLFMILGGTAIHRFAQMEASASDLSNNYTVALGYLGDMRQAVMGYRAAVLRAMVLRDKEPGAPERLDAALRPFTERLVQAQAKYESTVETPEERQLYDEFRTSWGAFLAAEKEMQGFVHQARFDDAAALVPKVAPLGARVDAALQKDAEFNAMTAADLAREITGANQWGFRIVAGGVLVSVFIAVMAGWLLLRSIAGPVRQITSAMHQLARRDVTVEIPGVGRGDEIGGMASAVQVFKDNMIAAERMTADRAAEQTAKEQRVARLDSLVRGFEAKAAGLVKALASASSEMEATARSMAVTAKRTSEQASEVGSSADAASAGAQTVASAADELSASIGEISRQVDQSSKITGDAVAAAQRTDAIVHDLAEGAQKIGDVVGLIASIAGQTNLLNI